jgi:hypothetical protein
MTIPLATWIRATALGCVLGTGLAMRRPKELR